ncbi:MAG: hypothetical protein JW913_17895 [Chitinispirillaceae bacterium]|nr:hypothetical protein [Chitinispirillaceae bacterium]
MTRFFLFAGLLAALHISCALPGDPAKDPGNALTEFTLINDSAPVEPVEVTAGDSIGVTCQLHLEQFIDSIVILIVASGDGVDTHDR